MIELDLGSRPYPEYWRISLSLNKRVRDKAAESVLTWSKEIRRAA